MPKKKRKGYRAKQEAHRLYMRKQRYSQKLLTSRLALPIVPHGASGGVEQAPVGMKPAEASPWGSLCVKRDMLPNSDFSKVCTPVKVFQTPKKKNNSSRAKQEANRHHLRKFRIGDEPSTARLTLPIVPHGALGEVEQASAGTDPAHNFMGLSPFKKRPRARTRASLCEQLPPPNAPRLASNRGSLCAKRNMPPSSDFDKVCTSVRVLQMPKKKKKSLRAKQEDQRCHLREIRINKPPTARLTLPIVPHGALSEVEQAPAGVEPAHDLLGLLPFKKKTLARRRASLRKKMPTPNEPRLASPQGSTCVERDMPISSVSIEDFIPARRSWRYVDNLPSQADEMILGLPSQHCPLEDDEVNANTEDGPILLCDTLQRMKDAFMNQTDQNTNWLGEMVTVKCQDDDVEIYEEPNKYNPLSEVEELEKGVTCSSVGPCNK